MFNIGPGFINVFSKSALYFSDINSTAAKLYLNAAITLANVTWNRGLLVKGTMFCMLFAVYILCMYIYT